LTSILYPPLANALLRSRALPEAATWLRGIAIRITSPGNSGNDYRKMGVFLIVALGRVSYIRWTSPDHFQTIKNKILWLSL